MVLFFLFKQKTAYEMRISDWRSDVCSSDLVAGNVQAGCRSLGSGSRFFLESDQAADRWGDDTGKASLSGSGRSGAESWRAPAPIRHSGTSASDRHGRDERDAATAGVAAPAETAQGVQESDRSFP